MTDNAARILADYQASDFAISNVNLTFELADNATIVTNEMKISRVNNANTDLVLNGEHLTLLSVSIDGETLNKDQYQVTDELLTIEKVKSNFTLIVVTEVNPEDNTSLEGLFKSGGAFCTQCEAEGFRRISYYLDRPDVMAKFTTKIIADKNNYPFLLSNGNKIAEGDLPNNMHFVTWQDPFLKPCYLFALVAGDFDLLVDTFKTSSGKDVALEIFVDRGNLFKAHHAMESLKKSMQWDEETFGLEYDLDIYMIVAVDFFNMGAMENKGLNVFNSKFVLADQKSATDTDYFNIEAVIAHEYFHNWTGNRVTCRDWFQLSLKEGLTVFRDQQFSADMHSAAVARIQNVRVLRAHQFAEDAGPMAHPIRPEKVVEMNNFYTLTVYEKGAEVIRMIHTLLGKDNFRKGMDLYFKRFDGMAVTCDDFVDAMADASGVNLQQFKHWYSQSGTPELTVVESYDETSNKFYLTVKQINKPSKVQPEKTDLHIPIKIELINGKQKEQHCLALTKNEQTWQFNNFKSKPIVAFLSDFSAPVKVNFQQDNDELETLMVDASDAFNRWDAGQSLLTGYILTLMNDSEFALPQKLITAFAKILTSDSDPALKAEQITLPSFDELLEQANKADPIVLLNAIKQVKVFLATGLNTQFLDIYQTHYEKSYSNDSLSIGERALKNKCFSYLSEVAEHQSLITKHYEKSDNMTDTLAALSACAKVEHSDFSMLMADFEQQWYETPLVMDKWFTIQASLASEEIFTHLDKLLSHPLFTLKNPNRARALIGAFAHQNPRYFHCISGRGYQFLTMQLKQLNEINPQVASRLITPLIQFDRFDDERQLLMKEQLAELALLPNLSKDLKEKLDAALKI
ncbi:aminopeptidase N [Colwellia sp. 1_MG-2023]|uniref:aminopeptidase N n=1 Tax=Colwellia sp. 1_MG-2023 TaxID=3062649 RepID=UPI0026E264AB|nr:aminopeptidase N [Colwellia sp. 1_MG-2023]MDO6446039.1 aminopeptidase N [Colwellia sp. 1_MG-2023]